MVEKRSKFPHQFSGTIPSISGSCSISQGAPHLFRHRQPLSMSHINKLGGHLISNTVKSSSRIMELCPEHKPDNFSHPHSREAECPGSSQIKNFKDSIESMFNPSIFRGVVARLGRPDIDLFASRVNHQILEFVSWRPEPNAVATDAFDLSWNYHLSYLFPPFSLIPLCLKKILRDQAECTLTAPARKSRPWYPILLSMLSPQALLILFITTSLQVIC